MRMDSANLLEELEDHEDGHLIRADAVAVVAGRNDELDQRVRMICEGI